MAREYAAASLEKHSVGETPREKTSNGYTMTLGVAPGLSNFRLQEKPEPAQSNPEPGCGRAMLG